MLKSIARLERGQESLLHKVFGGLAPSDSRHGIAIKGITVPL